MDEYSVIEATMSILLRGGWVLLPLFLIGWLGWFLMFERFGYYLMLKGRSASAFFTIMAASALTSCCAFLVWWSSAAVGSGTKMTGFCTKASSEIEMAPAREMTTSARL